MELSFSPIKFSGDMSLERFLNNGNVFIVIIDLINHETKISRRVLRSDQKYVVSTSRNTCGKNLSLSLSDISDYLRGKFRLVILVEILIKDHNFYFYISISRSILIKSYNHNRFCKVRNIRSHSNIDDLRNIDS